MDLCLIKHVNDFDMPGRIPPEFIDQLLAQADIVEVVGSRIALKKAGREFQACCPFHHEKTPSFTVSPAKQFYHCFGCGAHGSAISFLMEYDNLEFPDAVEELAQQLGMEVPRDEHDRQAPDYRPLYTLLEQCRQFYSHQLRQPVAAEAVEYLKNRGVSGEIAARYQLGYAPPGWDNLLRALGGEQRTRQLIDTGMLTSQGNRCYDRFRQRIMFPIRDRRGRVIGFGGRVIGDDTPKYLNSPETPIFHKGRELYGLYEARQANKQLDRLLLVEGYMDVVALAQFGIDYAVATLGTATTTQHLELVFRSTASVVFCFDGDRAGRDAGWKALQTCLPLMRDGRQAGFLFLPDKEDPDSLIRDEGREAFEQRISDALPLSDYLFEKIAGEVDMRSLDGRARFAEQMKPYLQQLPEGIFRELLQQRLQQVTGLQSRHVGPAGQTERTQPGRHAPVRQHSKTGLNTIPPVRRAIALLLHFPERCRETPLPGILRDTDTPGLPLLAELHELVRNHPGITLGAILEHFREREEARHLHKITLLDLDVIEADAGDQFAGVLLQLVRQQADEEWQQLLAGRSPGQLSEADRQRLQELQALKNIQTIN